jgi:hypothetical protein
LAKRGFSRVGVAVCEESLHGSPCRRKVPAFLSSENNYTTIKGDGNCLFRALAYAVTGSEDEHPLMRAVLCKEMKDRDDEGRRHVRESGMQKNGVWGTTDELFSASRLLKSTIAVWSQFGASKSWQLHGEGDPTLYLDNGSGDHFNVVMLV